MADEAGLTGRGLLMLWLDVLPSMQAETDEWYAREHLPDRIGPGGYREARRYRAEPGAAAPAYLSCFVADTPDALAAPGYLGLVRQISEQSRRIRAAFANVARNTFRCVHSIGAGTGGAIAALRLAPGTVDARREWLAGTLLPQLAAAQGVVAVHLLAAAPEIRARMDAVRVTGLEDAGTGDVLLVEAMEEANLRQLRDGPLASAHLRELGIGEEDHGIYRLQHALMRSG